jgi:hypothetical protein
MDRVRDSDISEATLQASALAITNVWRKSFGCPSIAWNDPNFSEDEKRRALEEARAALDAVRRLEAKEKVSAAKVSRAIKAGCSAQHGSCSYPHCAGAECEFFAIAIRNALEAAAEEGRSRE